MRAGDLSDVYMEIADRIGVDVAVAIHDMFRGQQVQFPQKLYRKEYIYAYVKEQYNGRNVREISQKFGYSDRRIRQILKELDIG